MEGEAGILEQGVEPAPGERRVALVEERGGFEPRNRRVEITLIVPSSAA